MNSRVESMVTTAHISHKKMRTAGMRSVEHQLLSDSGSLVCNTTLKGGDDRGGRVWLRLGDFLPLIPWNECILPQGWAGPPYNTEHNQRAGLENFLFTPPLTLTFSLLPSSSLSVMHNHKHVSNNTCAHGIQTYIYAYSLLWQYTYVSTVLRVK